jgi:hypothetical protein
LARCSVDAARMKNGCIVALRFQLPKIGTTQVIATRVHAETLLSKAEQINAAQRD